MRCSDRPAWQATLARNDWIDLYLSGPAFCETFLAEERTRAARRAGLDRLGAMTARADLLCSAAACPPAGSRAGRRRLRHRERLRLRPHRTAHRAVRRRAGPAAAGRRPGCAGPPRARAQSQPQAAAPLRSASLAWLALAGLLFLALVGRAAVHRGRQPAVLAGRAGVLRGPPAARRRGGRAARGGRPSRRLLPAAWAWPCRPASSKRCSSNVSGWIPRSRESGRRPARKSSLPNRAGAPVPVRGRIHVESHVESRPWGQPRRQKCAMNEPMRPSPRYPRGEEADTAAVRGQSRPGRGWRSCCRGRRTPRR